MNTCLLCTLKETCEQKSFILFPTTAIVREILIRMLWDAKIAHRVDSGIVMIDASVQEEYLSSALKGRLHEIELRDIRVTRSRGAEMMSAPSVFEWLNQADTAWFDHALSNDLFTTFFQPIVDRGSNSIHAHECLVRLSMERLYNGGEILNAAVSRGRVHVFDSYVRQLSVRMAAAQHVAGTRVFINFMPSSIYDPAFCMKSTLEALGRTKLQPQDIVFEVVESEAVTDRKHLQKICDYYRDRGFGFALDDIGTGANSLQMVCDLRPDYMKIDKSLVTGIEDSMYKAAIRKMVELGNEFGVQVIAEGVETQATADACSDLGIRLMQGYYFARPAAEMVTTPKSLMNLQMSVKQSESVRSSVPRSRMKKIPQHS